MNEIKLHVKAYRMASSDAELNPWLRSEDFGHAIQHLDSNQCHALIEYIHRACLVDTEGLTSEIDRGEIGEYGLRGRIFWEEGQISWRRFDDGQVSVLVMTERTAWSAPPKPEPVGSAPATETSLRTRDRRIIMWGTLKDGAYYEKRVAGSWPILYPEPILKDKGLYPVLKVRDYTRSDGQTILWRLRGLGSENQPGPLPPVEEVRYVLC